MSQAVAPMPVRRWLGVATLAQREMRRFLKVWMQTLIAPLITTLIFLAIFALALDRTVETLGGVPFLEFLAPGLAMMAMAQNAFANTSSSLMVAKIQGNIVDTLMPPLSADELTLGFAWGGVARGMVVGTVVAGAMALFVPISVHSLGYIVFHGAAASLLLALMGIAGAIWADKFDHIAAVTNFVVTPLSFLSGTFYSIERLPEAARIAAHLNPFFYMIDGFRYGFIGHADGSLTAGVLVMLGSNAVLWLICRRMFALGYKLKT